MVKIIHPYHKMKKYQLGKYTWSELEIGDLAKAWIAISIAFAIVLSGAQISVAFLMMFIVSALTVGVGFIFHEMGHKMVAQHYGIWAEFRANYTLLLIAIAMSFLGFVIAAPGAVVIGMNRHADKKKMGHIAAAGPIMNIILALMFLPLFMLFQNPIVFYGFFINAFLALFNMIPFGIFDGYKILKWNKTVYTLMLVVSAAMVYFAFAYTGA